MATTLQPPRDDEATTTAPKTGGHLEADIDAAALAAEQAESAAEVAERPPTRIAIAVAFPNIAAAVLVGGIFTGIAPRPVAILGSAFGIGLAVLMSRMGRRPLLTNLLIVVGLFLIGLLMLFPDFGAMSRVQRLASDAARQGNLLRPPAEFIDGWKPIVGWLMGLVGFTSAWLAIVVKRPSIGLLLPLPIAGIAAISVPDSQQVASGIVAFVLFAIGLGLLSSEQATGDDDNRPPVSYEVRKALKALPLIVILCVGLIAGQKYLGFLFPDPIYDPAQEPQKPKTTPITEVEDRVLFEVESKLSGPWRVGSLDVYQGGAWRLPPFAASELVKIERSGRVDPDLEPAVDATITVAGLGGAVLPVLPNTVGIVARGPKLSYDARNGNIRLVAGQVNAGFTYQVVAAGLPKVSDLQAVTDPLPPEIEQFTDMPGPPPPAVQSLIDQAPTTSKWDQFDYLRNWVLEEVVASGPGTPVDITPERLNTIVGSEKKGSPFEIVAAQAMLARYIGVPSRIGYGFDGGELINDRLQVRPRHGAAFPEVYFPGFKWLPVIGTPKQAEPSVGNDPNFQRVDPSVLPSNDVAVQIYLPVVIPPGSTVAKQIAVTILVAVPIILLAVLIYVLYPAVRKARLRARRREAALRGGTRARVALAYAEWRDYATDLGFMYPTDTPLMYLDRFIEDDEHTELAWLTTRVLWGDLQGDDDPVLATIAEELSRSLRRRLGAAQPGTVRAVAVVSRLSLRHPFAPATDLSVRAEKKEDAREALPV